MGNRRLWIRLGAATGSGAMVAALFPPFNFAALVWVALVPLLAVLWSLEGERKARRGFVIGGLAGLVSCGIQFHWFAVVSWAAAIAVPVYLSLYWAAFGAFAATLGNPWRDGHPERRSWGEVRHSLITAFCLAAVWAGLECLRGWMLTGFGWNGLGVAFHRTAVLAQSADLLGVTGLAMVPVFFQCVLLQTAARLMRSARSGRRATRLDFGIAALLVAVLVAYGLVRLSTEARKDSLRLKTMLVQINIPQDAARVLWDPLQVHLAYEEETHKALTAVIDADAARLQQAVSEADEGGIQTRWPDWVMWPESALSGSILTAPDGTWGAWMENMQTIARVREAGPFQLIYGVTEFEAEANPDEMLVMKPGGRAWNSLAVMNPQDILQTYRKQHLVLFGETIPLVEQIPLLKKIYESQAGIEFGGSFTPGTSSEPLSIPLANGTLIQAVPTVCFEDSVPRQLRQFLRDEPQVIVNVTNDGWFKESPAAAQHFANARFRCIEFRRPMLRCANNGVSAAIDSTGSTAHPDTGVPQILVDASGSHFTRGSLLAEVNVPIKPTPTLYAMIGDWGVIVISLMGLAVAWLRKRKCDTPAIMSLRP